MYERQPDMLYHLGTYRPDPVVRIEGAGMYTDRERRWAAVCAHRERLLRIARARVDNAHDAEDCVQEAMLRCVEFADLDEARLGQFLTTVTIRLCADVHRVHQRGARLSRRLTSYVSAEPGPEEAVCDRAESAWLSRVLDSLSPRQRAIVEARAEGLSCTAVAERVAITSTAVESAMARVRRSLRVALESTFGLAALRPRRVARTAVGAVTVTASALTVLSLVSVTPHRPGAVVAAPRPVRPYVTPASPGAGARVARTGARAAAPVAYPAPVRRAARAVPGGDGSGDQTVAEADTPLGGGQVTQGSDTWVEAAQRCLRNGVVLDGYVVECGHDNDDEGTPR